MRKAALSKLTLDSECANLRIAENLHLFLNQRRSANGAAAKMQDLL